MLRSVELDKSAAEKVFRAKMVFYPIPVLEK